MHSLHFNIDCADSRHAKWKAYISIFTMRILAMLHGQPIIQHLSADSRHYTWKTYISTFNLQIPAMLHEQPTFQNLLPTLLA